VARKGIVRIGIVAGEVSGDMLGAGLMRALKKFLPGARFEGIGGPRMQAEGCRSLYPMEKLSIIGFESLGKYPEIREIRRRLCRRFLEEPPDVFIGVDAPDFNLGLERRLKSAGVLTVHYVSPTVWAWRGWRIRLIRRAVDHMLTLFPFEARYYRERRIPVTFVGHPLADQAKANPDRLAVRKRLRLPRDRTLVALLPGSRLNELRRHADLFVETALWLHRRHPDLHFVAPFVDAETLSVFRQSLHKYAAENLPLTLLPNHSRAAMAASDIVLLASGTATLEAALLGRLMVVTYKVSPLSYFLIRLFSRVSHYSLPNNLAGRELVPEYLQDRATPENLGRAVEYYLSHPGQARSVLQALDKMQRSLRRNADAGAAAAVFKLFKARRRAARLPVLLR
jgi:lipid-A-disaccharide synthase